MKRRLACALAGSLLLAGAGILRWNTKPKDEAQALHQPLLTVGRDLARPWALPVLWRSLRRARFGGTPEEYVATGRLIMRMLPEWTDGHIHIAWQMAFDASLAQADPDEALDRTLAGVAMLEQSLQHSTLRLDEILAVMASILQIRCEQQPELARRFRQRLGRDPFALAERYLVRAQAVRHADTRTSHRIFSRTKVIPGLIDMNNLDAVRSLVSQTLRDAAQLPPSPQSQSLQEGLRLLSSYLEAGSETTVEELATNPYLQEIVVALRQHTAEK